MLKYCLNFGELKLKKSNVIYITRFLRRAKPSINLKVIPKQNDHSETIELNTEKLDLDSKHTKLSTAARLAIKNDSNFVRKNFGDSLVNDDGEILVKKYKFRFDGDSAMKTLEEEESSNELAKTKTEQFKIPTMDSLELEEDAKIPISYIPCSGCGALLQCKSRHLEGFMPADKYKILSKNELSFAVCFRCETLNRKKIMLNLKSAKPFDYDDLVINKILSQRKAHVILLIDLLDIPNSIYDNWSRLIKNKTNKNKDSLLNSSNLNQIDICIIGNKVDLLPDTGPIFYKSIIECLKANCEKKGIAGDQIKYIELISAKSGYNIENMITRLFKLWNDEGNVYLLGMANAGKSVLFNQLISSDYCRTLASDAITRATTSFWPGTTLHMLKFPINFLDSKKRSLRSKRLINDTINLEKIEKTRFQLYKKTYDLKHAAVIGIVGNSFKQELVSIDEIDAKIDSTYSMDELTGEIKAGENFDQIGDFIENRKKEARNDYKHTIYENKAAWFYDTPGVLGPQKILNQFSKKELQITSNLGLIMPRIYWMKPGQTLFVGGLIRIDLLESTQDDFVLFSIMASPALPIINPFKTEEADSIYEEYYEKGNLLRVPHKQSVRENPLPKLDSKVFHIDCIGNHMATSDIVFSCFGWSAVTSRPNSKAVVRAFTLGGLGLELRQPSLLPFIVNMRKKYYRRDDSQAFKSIFYKISRKNFGK